MNPFANLDEASLRALATAVGKPEGIEVNDLYNAILGYLDAGRTDEWNDDIWACYQLKCFRDREGADAGREQLVDRIACGFNKCMLSDLQKNYFCDWLDAVERLPVDAGLFQQFQCAHPRVFSILGY
jgi:hypothetical protein